MSQTRSHIFFPPICASARSPWTRKFEKSITIPCNRRRHSEMVRQRIRNLNMTRAEVLESGRGSGSPLYSHIAAGAREKGKRRKGKSGHRRRYAPWLCLSCRSLTTSRVAVFSKCPCLPLRARCRFTISCHLALFLVHISLRLSASTSTYIYIPLSLFPASSFVLLVLRFSQNLPGWQRTVGISL